MNSSRRVFLAQASVAAGTVLLTNHLSAVAFESKLKGLTVDGKNAVTIYHTNGINGAMEPVYKRAGGLGQISAHLKEGTGSHLLLDAGNFLSAGLNFEQQKRLIEVMNDTGYKAAAVSGLDLSGDGRQLKALIPYMQFPLVNCNHRFTPALKSIIKPYRIFNNGAIKIGVTAVCTAVKGATYMNAVACANRTARFLKETERCHLVICLSDLGPSGREDGLSDPLLAQASEHIDMIIGNDHGKFPNNDMVLRNKLKNEVIFSAAASEGLTLGKTVVTFNNDKQKNGLALEQIIPGKPAGQNYGAALRELLLGRACRKA